MKIKNITVLCLFLVILSLNVISATYLDDNNESITNEIHETKDNNGITSDISRSDNVVYVDANSNSDIEDGSINSPYKTISNGNLEKVSSNSTIYVSEGTYSIDPTTINKNLSIIGQNTNQVIFIPNESSSTFTIESDVEVSFINFTLENFESDSYAAITNNGHLIIENMRLLNNVGTTTSTKGGSILNNGNLEVINSYFEGNMASWGAAVYNTKNTVVINSSFIDNEIYNVGGALYSIRGNLTVYDSYFNDNRAVSGAAIYNAFGNLYVNNTTFYENDAQYFYGGAIYSTGIATVTNTVFDSNHARMDGGAITNTNNFTIINCDFIENFADENGGAIENVPWSAAENGNLTIINSSFIENAASNKGGVFINYNKVEAVGEPGTITVRNCLFEYNSASIGGVAYNEQYIDFQNNVFIENDAEEYPTIYSEDTWIKSIDNNWWGSNNPTIDEIGVMPNTWVTLQFTNTTQFITNVSTTLEVSLNTLNNGESLTDTLPVRTAIFSAANGILSNESLNFTDKIDNNVVSMGKVNVLVDNQILSLEPLNLICVTVSYDEISDVFVGENVTITGKFTDVNGKAISNSNVKIIINGKKYYARTDNKGIYTYTMTASVEGQNNVTVGYSGNSKYAPYETCTTFNVNKKDVIVTYEVIEDTKYSDNVTITGKFTDVNGKAISNSNVKIIINGKKYYARTDNKGVYVLVTRVTEVGLNNVTVGYSGNNIYNGYAVNTTFNAEKQDVIVTYEGVGDVYVGDNMTISGKFVDATGRAVTSTNVKMIINSKKCYVKTDANGLFNFTVEMKTPGSYEVFIGYSGNIKYNEYTDSTVFNVLE